MKFVAVLSITLCSEAAVGKGSSPMRGSWGYTFPRRRCVASAHMPWLPVGAIRGSDGKMRPFGFLGHPACADAGYWFFFSDKDDSVEGIKALELELELEPKLAHPKTQSKPIKGTPMWALDPHDPEDPVNIFKSFWKRDSPSQPQMW